MHLEHACLNSVVEKGGIRELQSHMGRLLPRKGQLGDLCTKARQTPCPLAWLAAALQTHRNKLCVCVFMSVFLAHVIYKEKGNSPLARDSSSWSRDVWTQYRCPVLVKVTKVLQSSPVPPRVHTARHPHRDCTGSLLLDFHMQTTSQKWPFQILCRMADRSQTSWNSPFCKYL